MRFVRAGLGDAYHVHKTLMECLTDCGMDVKQFDQPYEMWLRKLQDEASHYILMLHGRKVVGMVWGKEQSDEPRKTILVEGRFLRRAYRGKLRFTRDLKEAFDGLVKEFEVVRMLLPHNKVKLGKYRPIGTIVERTTK
jgi:hypothetical protein